MEWLIAFGAAIGIILGIFAFVCLFVFSIIFILDKMEQIFGIYRTEKYLNRIGTFYLLLLLALFLYGLTLTIKDSL